jgi:hypothetical protein
MVIVQALKVHRAMEGDKILSASKDESTSVHIMIP